MRAKDFRGLLDRKASKTGMTREWAAAALAYVTVTISPLPSLRMTSSHSSFSPVSKQIMSVGSTGFNLIILFSWNARPRTTSKWFSSDRYTVCVVLVFPTVMGHLPRLYAR